MSGQRRAPSVQTWSTTNILDGDGGPTGPPKASDLEPLAVPWGEAVVVTDDSAGQPLQPEPDS